MLGPYWRRIADARAAFARGELPRTGRQQARGAAFEHVAPTPAEQAALHEIFTMCAPLVAAETHKVWSSGAYACALETALGHAWEAFARTVSAFDPSRGVKITTWITTDVRAELRAQLLPYRTLPVQVVTFTDLLAELDLEGDEEGFSVADTTAPDLAGFLDPGKWAETYTTTRPALRVVYKYLTMRDDPDTT